jgi:putative tricarboxylic transport membrane protein
MRTADIVTGAIIMVFGLLVVFDSVRLGFGWEENGPQAGFYPFVMGMIMVIGCIIIIIQAIQRKGVAKSDKPFIPREAVKPVLQVVIPATLMVAATEYIGLYVAAAIYMCIYMRWIGKHSWKTVLPITLIVPSVTWYVFEKLFLIPMPQGSLMGWLPF